MMFGVITSDSKAMALHWFPCGLKVGQKEYLEVMETVVKLWIEENYPKEGYAWQQDGAPGHKAKRTQDWCKENLEDFWQSNLWPPLWPDCLPLDYAIWGIVERKACCTPHKNVDDLKAAVDREWAAMEPDFSWRSCTAFWPSVEAMVAAEGRHFEV